MLGHAIFIWAKSPRTRRGPTSAIRVTCKTHPHRGVDCKFPLAYIMPRSWGQGGLSSLTIFSQTLAAASLSPLVCAFVGGPSHGTTTLDHLCRALSAEPPSWSLLRRAFIQNNHQAFVRDLRRETFPGQAFIQRPSPEAFSGRAFVRSLFPSASSGSLLLSAFAGTFSCRPSPGAFSYRPSPGAFSHRPS
jgi:hypothetical protein